MRLPMKSMLLALAACVTLGACEKPTAKFHPGDRVRVKLSDTRGVVKARIRPLVHDLYFLRVAGSFSALYRGGDPKCWDRDPDPKASHIEGPYYDTDMELAK